MSRLFLSLAVVGILCRNAPADEPTDIETAAHELNVRAQTAFQRRDFAEAERLYRLVQEDYPATRSWGVAVFNLGCALKLQGRLDEAIQQFLTIFPSRLSDHEPGSHIMELARNYRHKAAVQIADCYELQGSHALAIDWLDQARDKYHDDSGCGNCKEASRMAIECRLQGVLLRAGSRRESIELGTKLILNRGGLSSPPLQSCAWLAEAVFGTPQQAELEAQIKAFCEQRIASKQRDGRLHTNPNLPNDGHTLATRWTLDCLNIFENAKGGGVEWLWQQLMSTHSSACRLLMQDDEDSDLLRQERIRFIVERLRVHPDGRRLLVSQKDAGDQELAFALVLLATGGAIRNPEAIHRRLASAIDESRRGEWVDDYLFALLLADPASVRSLHARYARGPLASYWRTAAAAWHRHPRGFASAAE